MPLDVFTLQYMRRLRHSLVSNALWPHKIFEGQTITSHISAVYRCILIILTSLHIVSTVVYLSKHRTADLGHMYCNVLMASVNLQRLFLPFQSNFCLVMKKFIYGFHLMHLQAKTDYAEQIYDRVNKICTVLSTVAHLQVVLAVMLYNLVPLYNNFQAGMFNVNRPPNGTFQHSIDYELPFDQYSNYRGYFIVFFYNWYVCYTVAVGICMYDLLIFTIVFHIWGHLKILSHCLKFFPRAYPRYFEQGSLEFTATQEELLIHLKSIISHHQMIKEFMTKTSEAFSITLCFYLVFHQLIGCVLLLKCSSMDPTALGRYGLITFIVFQQLIQASVIFELIRSKGDTLPDEVYSLPWESMDTKNKRLVLMFLPIVQTPLALKAAGIVPVGVITMFTIMKTSYSYFMMLRTFTK